MNVLPVERSDFRYGAGRSFYVASINMSPLFIDRSPPMSAKPRKGGMFVAGGCGIGVRPIRDGMFVEPTPKRHVQSRRDGMFIEAT